MKLKKKVFSLALAGTMLSSSLALAFTDTPGHWAYKYINDLEQRGVVEGYPDGTFKPEGLISREEAAQMISNHVGGPPGSDGIAVPADAQGRWSTDAIYNLMVKSIVDGYPDGTFKPESKITRAEFVTMIYKMLKKDGALDASTKSFADSSSHWAVDAIESLAGNGFIEGYPDGTFKPDASIKRSEAATIISKIYHGGDFSPKFTLEEAFIDSANPMPVIKQGLKEAIIATGIIKLEHIGSIGSWSYPSSLYDMNMQLTDKGLWVDYEKLDYGIDGLTIPYSRLLSVLTPEFVYSLGDQSLVDKLESGNISGKKIALTLDGGPSPGTTEQALDILKKHGVKATFFVVGDYVKSNPDLVKRELAESHEIGNHSWNHPYYTQISDATIHQQMLSTSMAIYQATGQFPSVFRPPYGDIDSRSAITSGMPVIVWSLDSIDWILEDADAIVDRVNSKAKDGDIILGHDTKQYTIDSLDRIITHLKAQGYEFVTVSEMYGYKLYPSKEYTSETTVVNY